MLALSQADDQIHTNYQKTQDSPLHSLEATKESAIPNQVTVGPPAAKKASRHIPSCEQRVKTSCTVSVAIGTQNCTLCFLLCSYCVPMHLHVAAKMLPVCFTGIMQPSPARAMVLYHSRCSTFRSMAPQTNTLSSHNQSVTAEPCNDVHSF